MLVEISFDYWMQYHEGPPMFKATQIPAGNSAPWHRRQPAFLWVTPCPQETCFDRAQHFYHSHWRHPFFRHREPPRTPNTSLAFEDLTAACHQGEGLKNDNVTHNTWIYLGLSEKVYPKTHWLITIFIIFPIKWL